MCDVTDLFKFPLMPRSQLACGRSTGSTQSESHIKSTKCAFFVRRTHDVLYHLHVEGLRFPPEIQMVRETYAPLSNVRLYENEMCGALTANSAKFMQPLRPMAARLFPRILKHIANVNTKAIFHNRDKFATSPSPIAIFCRRPLARWL